MKQKVARRGFLKLMGGAAVGGKQVAQTAVEQAGLTLGLGSGGYGSESDCGIMDGGASRQKEVWQRILRSGIPQFKLDQIWKESAHVRVIDPDIAAFRSFSLVAKAHLQRQRQFEERLDHLRFRWFEDKEQEDFLKANGLDYF